MERAELHPGAVSAGGIPLNIYAVETDPAVDGYMPMWLIASHAVLQYAVLAYLLIESRQIRLWSAGRTAASIVAGGGVYVAFALSVQHFMRPTIDDPVSFTIAAGVPMVALIALLLELNAASRRKIQRRKGTDATTSTSSTITNAVPNDHLGE